MPSSIRSEPDSYVSDRDFVDKLSEARIAGFDIPDTSVVWRLVVLSVKR